jgi:hypothetical protein
MVASGKFATAVVSPGGISATLPNGLPALVFADHVGDTSLAAAAQRVALPPADDAARRPYETFEGAPETIAILVNNTDKSRAFNPAIQTIIANAITAAGFSGPQYGVDNGDVSLDTIAGVSAGGFVDVFDISTHGMAAIDNGGNSYYAWQSDTPLSGAALAKYAADFAQGNLMYAVNLGNSPTFVLPTFAFTPKFVANHVEFANGAIFLNGSCFGQYNTIASRVGATLKSANVGRYFGWTTPVEGAAADETDAFIWDRLLGEGSTALGQLVTQRSPAQRAFPLDAIDSQLTMETRSGPLETSSLNYGQSPPFSGYVGATLSVSDFGGEQLATRVVEYGLPSISYVAVTEDPANPTLTIYGNFPPQAGEVAIIDPADTQAPGMTPTTWTTTKITIPIKVTGAGSKGLVVVISEFGIQSNAVPLTQWTGTLTGTENAAWTQMGSGGGNGSGTIGSSFAVDFRSDVHPTVPSIDASPVPQNFTLTQVEGDSTGAVTSISGSFATSDGKHSAVLGMSPNPPALTPGVPPLSNTFYLGPVAGQPATCNNAMAGPQSGPTNVFCPGLGFKDLGAGTCTDDAGTLCTSPTWNASGTIGATNSAANDGTLVFTMNPATYAITVTSTSPSTLANLFEATPQLTGGVTGTINAPVGAPSGMRPEVRVRGLKFEI